MIFSYIVVANLLSIRFYRDAKKFFYFLIFVFFVVFVGLRYQVGGDWASYLIHYENLDFENILLSFFEWDPGYVLFEYISKYLGLGIAGVNILCAITFFTCFFYFIKVFKIKLSHALLIAFPYLILVVVNGYTRQGVALGFGMLFVAFLYQRKLFKSFLALIFAVLFHKTAILLIILYIRETISNTKNNLAKLATIVISLLLGILVSISFQSECWSMIKNYIEYQMQSSGAIIRILVNIIPLVLLVVFSKRYKSIYNDYRLWILFGYITLSMLFLGIFFKITTVADRLCLYFYPLQIVIFPRVLQLIKNREVKYMYFFALICLYSSILLIWLLFAAHRGSWIPYRNFLFLE